MKHVRVALFGLAALHVLWTTHETFIAALACSLLAGFSWMARPRSLWIFLELALVNFVVHKVGYSLFWLYLPSMSEACVAYQTFGALAGGVLIGLGCGPYLGASAALTGLLLCEVAAQQRQGQQKEYDSFARQARQESSDQLEARELEIAWEVQQALMPRKAPELPGWQFAFEVWPARIIGGDLIQFFLQGQRLGCVVADVSGKGIPAAIVAGGLHQLLHRVQHLPLPDAISEINRTISTTAPDGFSVAMVFLWIDITTGEVQWVNAGSPHPLCRRVCAQVEAWSSYDLCAGWDSTCQYAVYQARLDPGDTLLIFTDGLPDIETEPGLRQGEDRIVEILRQHPRDGLKSALRELVRASVPTDDITFLAIHRENCAELQKTRS